MKLQRLLSIKTYYLSLLLILLNNSFVKAQRKSNIIEKDSVNYVLENIMKEDQILREKFNYALDNYGENSSEFELATQNLKDGDLINQDKIDSIFDNYGWLTTPSVSKEASMAYFYVIQHAQIEFQKKYREHVVKAFELGIIDIKEFQLFIDRVTIQDKKYQKYGTQIMTDNLNNKYLVPIDTTECFEDNFVNRIKHKFKDDDFILFANKDFVTLFVHAFNPKSNTPVAFLEIYLDNKKLGKTNKKGFFQTQIKRENKESTLTVIDVNSNFKQTIHLKYEKDIDFYDQYFGFEL